MAPMLSIPDTGKTTSSAKACRQRSRYGGVSEETYQHPKGISSTSLHYAFKDEALSIP
jgi:hypothetical protein